MEGVNEKFEIPLGFYFPTSDNEGKVFLVKMEFKLEPTLPPPHSGSEYVSLEEINKKIANSS